MFTKGNIENDCWQARLKTLMASQGFSQTDLAPVFGVSRAAVSHYLSGRTDPTVPQIAAVAKHMGISLDYLLNGNAVRQRGVPLLYWSEIDSYASNGERSGSTTDVNYVRCPVWSCSAQTFAVKVQGDSMESDGGYRHGDLIFVDPQENLIHGRDIIVKLPRQRLVLRRLSIHEDGCKYLRALNGGLPEHVIEFSVVKRVYGVVVFSGCFRI
ncbi:MAG: LexA family transcriptional regulator [Gammaproteobacteria bacterium]|nr:LexA family transcriptional regulator [Gammaproteobacteria bacterium]